MSGSALGFTFRYQDAEPVPIITPRIPAKNVIIPKIRFAFLERRIISKKIGEFF